MKDKLIKGFGVLVFYVVAMGCCIFVGAMVYLTTSNLFPVPSGLPTALPTKGPSPTPSPSSTPAPTSTPTSDPSRFSLTIHNRTGDETIGGRVATLLSDAGFSVGSVTVGSSTTFFGDPPSTRICVPDSLGLERDLADDICHALDIYCYVWTGCTGDADILLRLGPKEDWGAWLSERGY